MTFLTDTLGPTSESTYRLFDRIAVGNLDTSQTVHPQFHHSPHINLSVLISKQLRVDYKLVLLYFSQILVDTIDRTVIVMD